MSRVTEGLFRTRVDINAAAPITPLPLRAVEDLGKLHEEEGFSSAGKMQGSEDGLSICLNRIYQEYKSEARNDHRTQEENLLPVRMKLREREGDIARLRDRIQTIQNDKKPALLQRIEMIRREIAHIRQNPQEVIGAVPGRASFFIGIAILLCLSVYLFIFYSSASYSAFFKQFTPEEIGIANSIFDGQALTKAYTAGLTELILILMMPFVFLGLGFLIHKFHKSRTPAWWLKVSLLVVITFLFDAILAYEITDKIYTLEAMQAFQSVPEYTISMAFQDVKFWLIIFAGFLVYLIWGFVFDFMMEEHEKLDAVSMSIKNKEKEISDLNAELDDYDVQVDKTTHAIHEHEMECQKLHETLNGTVFVTKEFERRISNFMVGWAHWLSANKRSVEEVSAASQLSSKFLANLRQDAFSRDTAAA